MTIGIYTITCTVTGRLYVGQSINIERRWGAHRARLKSRTHTSPPLQRSWTKHGEDAFAFRIVEICDTQSLNQCEQAWVDRLRACEKRYGFNTARDVTAPMRGLVMSKATREKMSAAHKGKPKTKEHAAAISRGRAGVISGPLSESHRQAISAGVRGRRLSQEHRQKLRVSAQSRWSDPDRGGPERESLAAKRRGVKLTAEQRAAQSERIREAWKDPGKRQAMLANRGKTQGAQ